MIRIPVQSMILVDVQAFLFLVEDEVPASRRVDSVGKLHEADSKEQPDIIACDDMGVSPKSDLSPALLRESPFGALFGGIFRPLESFFVADIEVFTDLDTESGEVRELEEIHVLRVAPGNVGHVVRFDETGLNAGPALRNRYGHNKNMLP